MSEVNRTTHLEAQISPQALAVVRRATALQGRSLSDFVAAAAEEKAHKTIEDAHVIRLSLSDQERFAELLLDPPALSPAMLRAKEAHAALIQNSTNAALTD